MDPEWYDETFVSSLERATFLEIVENGAEVTCHGEYLDKVKSANKLESFQALKKAYDDGQKPFRRLVWVGKNIDWPVCGPYSVKTSPDYSAGVDTKVEVECKVFDYPSAPWGASTADPVLLEAFVSVYLASWTACCHV